MLNSEILKNNLDLESIITKRPATQLDTDFAKKVHHQAYHDVIVRQFGSFDEKIQDDYFFKTWNPEYFDILLYNGVDIGYFSVKYYSDHFFVNEFALLTEFHGKGIGTYVLKELIQEAITKKLPIKLQVLKQNFAQNLYRKLGFKDIESDETHIIMEFNPGEIVIE